MNFTDALSTMINAATDSVKPVSVMIRKLLIGDYGERQTTK